MHRFLLVLCALSLASCATEPAVRTAPSAAARTGIPAVDALYVRLEADTARYNAGLDTIAHGDTDTGRKATTGASTDLLDAASRCQATPSCDSSRFIAAYDLSLIHI